MLWVVTMRGESCKGSRFPLETPRGRRLVHGKLRIGCPNLVSYVPSPVLARRKGHCPRDSSAWISEPWLRCLCGDLLHGFCTVSLWLTVGISLRSNFLLIDGTDYSSVAQGILILVHLRDVRSRVKSHSVRFNLRRQVVRKPV